MKTTTIAARGVAGAGFRHEAYLYAGQEQFLRGTVPFIRDAFAADESVLVVVIREKIDRLRAELGGDVDRVSFLDMREVGRNPACLIPAWHDWVCDQTADGVRVRGVGEPIWVGRAPAEIAECQLHEHLFNLAFADGPGWWLLCLYDTAALDAEVIREARRSHPFVFEGGVHRESAEYETGIELVLFRTPLPEPGVRPEEMTFRTDGLLTVRDAVTRYAVGAELPDPRVTDLVLAVNEVAANSIRHGRGRGILRLWRDEGMLVCEIHDEGHIDQPLVGRKRPTVSQNGGRGLWLVHQLCDLVQIRSSAEAGTVVRMFVSLRS
ncbi:sensor histidine kinase [Carbonactinospora thermoautotrophica]|uniref:sensor histidine kinase n=1 Tax=Carbonactinospora thermoautotrophica TaxID=1469144 RepID=UPI00099F1285|nr:sensor histidine kinase [Carbonactinospora thermoautotrophica]